MSLITLVPFVPERTRTKFGRITGGEGGISRGSVGPLPQGGGAQALLNFGDSLLFLHTPFDEN